MAFQPVQAADPLTTGAITDYTALKLPKPGDHTLHILSSTLLELVRINTKQPDPARVDSWDFVDGNGQFQAPPTSAFAVTANGQPIAVQSVGFKRRPLYAPLARRDLRIENSLYLQLGSPILDGQIVEVKNPSGTLWSMSLVFSNRADPLRYSPAIHVNQEGYAPALAKKAMVGYYLGSFGEMSIATNQGFRLVDANTGTEVYQGSLTPRPDIGYLYSPTPYQKVYEANFTGFITTGEYRVLVPGLGASLPFVIHDGAALGFARTLALGLYHQRCGTSNAFPFTRHIHEACHTNRAEIPIPQSSFAFTWNTIAQYSADYTNNPRHTAPQLRSEATQRFPILNRGTVDVTRGHHDAGDYSKYTINSAGLIHYLMFAVDSLAGVAALDNLGLPESGDGTSDLMQEAKWEADYLAKLQDSDGGFYFLVYPRDREYESNVLPDQGDPQVVWPKNTAATAAAVAALAQTASSPRFKQRYPTEAALYLQKAQLGWNFLTNGIARFGKDGAYQKITHYGDEFMHDDELAWAACEMFLATTNATYQQKLIEWFDPASPATLRWGWWRLFESYGRAVRSYAFAARSGRLAAGRLNATFLSKCEAQLAAGAQDHLQRAQNNAYGASFPAQMKQARDAGWFFPTERAFDIAVAYQIDPRSEYLDAILSNLNYASGCNPVNVSYLTGMGWKRQREVVHQYAQNDRRVLPPSGIPLGAIQSGFAWLNLYGSELDTLCFPSDGAANAPYPFYDRWGDSYNVTTEFVILDQSRSLADLAFLATFTTTKTQAWTSATGQIIAPVEAAMNLPVTAQFQPPAGFDLNSARIVWEARDQEPGFGTNYVFVPTNRLTQWIEVEAKWPDGRRVFATANVFITNGPPTVSVVATDPSASEAGSDPGVFTFTRSTTNVSLTVFFNLSGTASNGVHYTTVGNSVTFPAGAATRTLVINPINNGATEGNKSVVVTIATHATYAITPPSSAVITIYDDEVNLLPTVAISNPSVDTVYLPNTNVLLTLEANVGDDGKPSPPGVLTLNWNRVSGFGNVSFSPSNAANTIARFSAGGIYVLRLTANDGQYQTFDEVTVVVDPDNAVTGGLQGYWKLNETTGTTAVDSSGNHRNASVSGALWMPGKFGNALDFDGVDDVASFSSPAMIQTTISAWIRADGNGDSFTPRVTEMPAYNVRLKRDAGNGHSLAFESERSIVADEWRTDLGTFTDAVWHHVAVVFDGSSLANEPQIYINGTNQNLTKVSNGSGSQVSNTGTGYIGNRATLDRSFDGRIDEVRIYNRPLTEAEIQLLAYTSISNLAPLVNAGPDRIAGTSSLVSLAGSASDDGKPNPPGALTANWSKEAGPGTVVFGNSNAVSTTANFSDPGTYLLRLAVSDGEVKVSDEVTITITNSLRITFVQASGGIVTLRWTSLAGKVYRVEYKTNLSDPGWTNLSGDVNATSSLTTWSDPAAGASPPRFYRISQIQ